jgi:hypothetical protein
MMLVASRSLSRSNNKIATAHFDINTPVWNVLFGMIGLEL